MKVAFVLRSGGEYRPEHVARLAGQVRAHLPEADVACFSDVCVPVERIPLRHDWPGWWSKMELFRPEVEGDLLYFDLDTTIVGNLSDLASVTGAAIMRDVYRPNGLQSSVMHIPQAFKADVWASWMTGPAKWMREFRRGGDQAFLEMFAGPWRLWQNVCPGRLVSYKADVHRLGYVPPQASVIVHHGKPRPWEISV